MVGVRECFRMAMYTYKAPSYHALQFLHHIATALTDSSCSAPYKHAYPASPPQGLCTPASTECICTAASHLQILNLQEALLLRRSRPSCPGPQKEVRQVVTIAEDKVKAGDEGLEPQVSTRGAEPRESSDQERNAAERGPDPCPQQQHKYSSMAENAASTARELAQRSKSDGERKRYLALCSSAKGHIMSTAYLSNPMCSASIGNIFS